MNDVHYSSLSGEWETPKKLFEKYNSLYNFKLDAAATKENTLCENFYTIEDDALNKDWYIYKSVWLNPPYGKMIGKFIKKAYEESLKGCIVVCLIPSRTDTQWFNNYVTKSHKIIFITGRLKFINKSFPSYKENMNFKISPAPFPSCIVVFDSNPSPVITWEKQKF